MSRLAFAAAHLVSRLQETVGELVTISSGRYSTSGVTAIAGSTRTEQIADERGTTVNHSVRDYLIERSDYVLNGEVVDPADGHKITRADGSVWIVSPIGNGEPAFRESSPHSSLLRIHTMGASQ